MATGDHFQRGQEFQQGQVEKLPHKAQVETGHQWSARAPTHGRRPGHAEVAPWQKIFQTAEQPLKDQ